MPLLAHARVRVHVHAFENWPCAQVVSSSVRACACVWVFVWIYYEVTPADDSRQYMVFSGPNVATAVAEHDAILINGKYIVVDG